MPTMCTLSTMPTTVSRSPWTIPRRCTGVIDITLTITRCPTAMAPTPSRAVGEEVTNAIESRSRAGTTRAAGTTVAAGPGRARATSSGSGRSSRARIRPTAPKASALNTNGPVNSGRPSAAYRVVGGVDQVGRDHRAERGGPDDHRELAAPARRRGQVDGGVPGLQVGCRAAAEQQHAEEEQREPVQLEPR